MNSVSEQLNNSNDRKLLCLEVNPPKGADGSKIFNRLDKHLKSVDFLNITDSALARMRMNPMVFAAELKKRYDVEPLLNMSCRDRNLIALSLIHI